MEKTKINNCDVKLKIANDKQKRSFKLKRIKIVYDSNSNASIASAEIEYEGRIGKKLKEGIEETILRYTREIIGINVI